MSEADYQDRAYFGIVNLIFKTKEEKIGSIRIYDVVWAGIIGSVKTTYDIKECSGIQLLSNGEYELNPYCTLPAEDNLLGDVNGDGKVTAADARLALRRAVGLETYKSGSREFLACDADSNGKITAADARKILRAAVGLEKLYRVFP